ncbi:MAG: type II toxin-antitoxin system VapB family antitoxin [Thermoanaerobaculia bacterium]|nr:type II toxin-antitoxin system VapB family antitoxin [Thermoanaerobaculia bacterium]
MALNIKDPMTEKLAAEVAAVTGENKTQAIRTALIERRERLNQRQVHISRRESLLRFFEQEIWPQAPDGALGRRVSREEREVLLGYGSDGV